MFGVIIEIKIKIKDLKMPEEPVDDLPDFFKTYHFSDIDEALKYIKDKALDGCESTLSTAKDFTIKGIT